MSSGLYALTVRTSSLPPTVCCEYDGNCERLHGHNWQVEVTWSRRRSTTAGSHSTSGSEDVASRSALPVRPPVLNEVPPFDGMNPSSENLARHLYEEMGKSVPAPARVSRVTVWESDDARADYSRRD